MTTGNTQNQQGVYGQTSVWNNEKAVCVTPGWQKKNGLSAKQHFCLRSQVVRVIPQQIINEHLNAT